jgi:STIP1 family protein 1
MSDWFKEFSKNTKNLIKQNQGKVKQNIKKIKQKVNEKKVLFKQLFAQGGGFEETKREDYKDVDTRRRASTYEGVKLQFKDAENENDLLMCPISQEIMTDPVMTPYGHCYQRSCIEAWLIKHDTCPITGQKLTVDQLIPCYTVKAIVDEYLSKQKGIVKVSNT